MSVPKVNLLFSHPEAVSTRQLELQTIVARCRQKVNGGGLSSASRVSEGGVEQLKLRQAKDIEGLVSKLKSVRFHQLYCSYQQQSTETIEPGHSFSSTAPAAGADRARQFRQALKNRSRKRKGEDIKEYFERRPEEEEDDRRRKPNLGSEQLLTLGSMHSVRRSRLSCRL